MIAVAMTVKTTEHWDIFLKRNPFKENVPVFAFKENVPVIPLHPTRAYLLWRFEALSEGNNMLDRLQWHPPMIFEFEDHKITPRAGQLALSSRHPKKEHTDREREAQMNKEAQDRWRERQYDKQDLTKVNPRTCYSIEADGDVLNMLVGLGWMQDNETDDPKEVAKAISDMLAEAARAWKKNH